MKRNTAIWLAGTVAVCAAATVPAFWLKEIQHGAPFATSARQPRLPKRLSPADYQTEQDARFTVRLREAERNRAMSSLDAHLIKPLMDDVRTRTLAVEGLEVTTEQFPELLATVKSCGRILHLARLPRVFISEGATLPIITDNYSEPVLIIQPGLLNRFREPAELRFLIGRELGHLQAGHVRWQTLLRQAKKLTARIVPFSNANTFPALLPLFYWARECEMTADNAGFICAQDIGTAERVLVQLAAGIDESSSGRINVAAYLRQAQTEKLSQASEGVLFWKELSAPVPFAPERIRQLRQYQSSDRYRAVWE
ncbi:MAG: hypothetical protein QOJ40_2191 [Verrucomicrobiota bacterium]